VHYGGDPGVSECTVQQWVVAGKTNSHVSLPELTAVAAAHDPMSAAKWLHTVLHWMFNCYSLRGASDIITADRDRDAVMTSRSSITLIGDRGKTYIQYTFLCQNRE